MATIYEWDYETVDENGDVEDHFHANKLSEYSEDAKTDTLVLVRSVGNEIDGLIEREWAYVKDGKLPEYFQDANEREGAKVPVRFHDELAQYLKH